MRQLVIGFLMLAAVLLPGHAQEDKAPAGYIISFDLRGSDQQRRTAIVRAGKELEPKIWMPLFSGDVVFVQDAASRVTLDMGQGGRIEVGGTLTRYEAEGEIETGDDAWTVITKIGGILAGGGDSVVPTNLVSKGDGQLDILSAINSPNFILRYGPPVLVVWTGGKAPFQIATDTGGGQGATGQTNDQRIEVAIPSEAAKRFGVIVTDATGNKRRIGFELREHLPVPPRSLAAAGPSDEFDAILLAGWLAERPRGAWRLEAMRRLNAMRGESDVAARFLAAISGGK